MGNKPVELYIIILRLLLPHQLNVNEIYRQTGLSYKQSVTRAIKELEKGKLTSRIKTRGHSQMEYIQLTELGRELADISMGLERYKTSFTELHNKIEAHFNIPFYLEKSIIKNKLESRGWSDEEASRYFRFDSGISLLRYNADRNIIDILINRFASALYKFSLTEITKSIMSYLLIDAMNFRLSYLLEDIKYNHNLFRTKQVENVELQVHINTVDKQFHDINESAHPYPHVLWKHVKDMLSSQLALLKPPEELIESYIEEAKQSMVQTQGKAPDIPKEGEGYEANDFTVLLEAYNDYLH